MRQPQWQDDQDAFNRSRYGDNYLLAWHFSDDTGENERFWAKTMAPDWMLRLLPLRAPNCCVAMPVRFIWAGWRACALGNWMMSMEPPVPAGTDSELTPAQQALAEFWCWTWTCWLPPPAPARAGASLHR